MKVQELDLPGVLVFEPRRFEDERGWFMETWNARQYAEAGLPSSFVQDNMSWSRRGVLRGLHYQDPHPQGKLIGVLSGEVWDVAVDIRPHSPTCGRWTACTLSETNGRRMFVPEGFAHGFVVTSEVALVQYKCTDFYHPEAEGSLLWCDPDLAIPWPVREPIVSDKDRSAGMLRGLTVGIR